MLTVVLKAVKMLLSCCPKNSQDAAVITSLKAVQDAEKNHPHKDQVQKLIPIKNTARRDGHPNNTSSMRFREHLASILDGSCKQA
jgi:hypothetical protein